MLKTLRQYLLALSQTILPHHFLSGVMHRLARCENRLWKNALIKAVVRLYGVNLSEAQETKPEAYVSFNAFFTRALKPDARPFCADADALLCPADGAISQIGDITAGSIIQAKGKSFSADELLGHDAERSKPFANGKFATIYLSPRDYHRLHMPLSGVLREMVHVPGRLFSVNAATTCAVAKLYARNERVMAIFDTAVGPMALVLVGAIFVSSIETVWHGEVTPPTVSQVRTWDYSGDAPNLAKGEEMGRFNMGSTIIVLFGENVVEWESALQPGDKLRLGQKLGRVKTN